MVFAWSALSIDYCPTPGKPDNFHDVARKLDTPVLGELPLVEGVSTSADGGYPYVLTNIKMVESTDGDGGLTWRSNMAQVAERVTSALWKSWSTRPVGNLILRESYFQGIYYLMCFPCGLSQLHRGVYSNSLLGRITSNTIMCVSGQCYHMHSRSALGYQGERLNSPGICKPGLLDEIRLVRSLYCSCRRAC